MPQHGINSLSCPINKASWNALDDRMKTDGKPLVSMIASAIKMFTRERAILLFSIKYILISSTHDDLITGETAVVSNVMLTDGEIKTKVQTELENWQYFGL